MTTPKNEVTSYEYLATGELAKIIDPLGNVTTFSYDSLGRMVKKNDPLGHVTELSYDSNGNVTQEIDPNGNVKKFTYDELDQMVKKTLPDNTFFFDYDVRGNLLAVEDDNSLIEFDYIRKEAGDLVSDVSFQGKGDHSSMGAYQLEMVYDNLGNRTALGSPVGEYQYDYDEGSRLVKISNHLEEEFGFAYDNGNRLTDIVAPKHSTSFAFDETNFLTQILHANLSNATLTSFIYTKDAIGNRTQKRTPAGDFDYGYDDNNQLTSATNPEASSESFSYDALGNRIQDTLGEYLYDTAKQRIQEDYKYFYTFDDNGNLTAKVEKDNNLNYTTYSYNSENQLILLKTFVDGSQIQEVSYAYDALGRRMEKVVDDKLDDDKDLTRRFSYDGNELLFETGEDNNILASYTHSTLRTDDPLAINITEKGVEKGRALTAGTYFYLKDGLGSVTDITNSEGELIQHYIYSSFGELLKVKNAAGTDITSSPALHPYLTYTAREYDKESSLYYYRARYYEPALGQFLTADPDPGKLSIPASFLSGYIYSQNNPIRYTDPSGESIFDDLGKWGSLALGGFLLGPLGQWAAVNFSGQFSQKDINIVNTVTFGAGSFAFAGPVAFGFATAGAAGTALATDGNFVDNFFEAAPLAYGSSILFSPNYYVARSTPAAWLPRISATVGAYSTYSLISENQDTIKRRLKRNEDLLYIGGACFTTGLCF